MVEIPEVKALRWLANIFPVFEGPQDESEKMSNVIHLYATVGADKIEELMEELNNREIIQE